MKTSIEPQKRVDTLDTCVNINSGKPVSEKTFEVNGRNFEITHISKNLFNGKASEFRETPNVAHILCNGIESTRCCALESHLPYPVIID